MPSILQRISAGDQTAIRACLDEYGDLVWRLARRYLSRADADVEDAVQEVFLELWVSAGRFDPSKGSEAAFVATLAHRRLTDHQRRITSRRRLDRDAIPELPTVWESRAGSAAKDGHIETALAAMRTLPESEREAIWLWMYRGLTHREIGEATSSPIGTVKSRIRRGLIQITEAVSRDRVGVRPTAPGRKGGVA